MQTPEEKQAERQLTDAITNYARVCDLIPLDCVVVDWLCSVAGVSYLDDGEQKTSYGFMGSETSMWHSLLGLSEYTSRRLHGGDDDE